MSLFNTGIRPAVDEWLLKKSQEKRNYEPYWSASSAGYCQRKVIFDRLQLPYVKEDARKQRVFTAGDLFHEWMQRITKEAGLSIAQELELQDEDLMIRGHIDDLILVNNHLILYDYKSQNSRAFSYAKDRPMSRYHLYQLGTYMYMLRQGLGTFNKFDRDAMGLKSGEKTITVYEADCGQVEINKLSEARILKISKDDLRMSEQELLWSSELEKVIVRWWTELNTAWEARRLPECTCAKHEGGFMAREAYNPYFYEAKPCSIAWLVKNQGVSDVAADFVARLGTS